MLVKINKGKIMKMRICLMLCLGAVSLFANDKIEDNPDVIYSQIVDTKKNESNVIIKEAGKDIKIFDNLLVTPRETGQFEIKIKGEDYDLTFNKSIEYCKKENGKQIDKTPLVYSALNTSQVVDFLEKVVDLKTGHKINLDLCKTDKTENGYYANLTINNYSIDTFPVKE